MPPFARAVCIAAVACCNDAVIEHTGFVTTNAVSMLTLARVPASGVRLKRIRVDREGEAFESAAAMPRMQTIPATGDVSILVSERAKEIGGFVQLGQ